MNYVEFFARLEDYGFTEAILPFFLVFVLVYAVLMKSEILGEKKKNFNVIVAVIFGLLVVIPHITGDYARMGVPDAVEVMNKVLPQVSLWVIGLLLLFVMLGLFGVKGNWPANKASGWLAAFAIGIIIYIFGSTSELNWWQAPRWSWWNSDTVSFLVILIVFALIIMFVTRDSEDNKGKDGLGNFMKEMGEHLKK